MVRSLKYGQAHTYNIPPGIVQLCCNIYFFICSQIHTIFDECIQLSIVDKVKKFHESGMKIERVIKISTKVQVISHLQCSVKIDILFDIQHGLRKGCPL